MQVEQKLSIHNNTEIRQHPENRRKLHVIEEEGKKYTHLGGKLPHPTPDRIPAPGVAAPSRGRGPYHQCQFNGRS